MDYWKIGVIALALAPAPSGAEEVLRNWFGDPFFQVRRALQPCPEPLGPFINEEQRLRETHYRSERGTRCWLEKKCSKPNSYMYDADIARDVKARFEKSPKLVDSSLWVTVQRRFVWIEGCARSPRAGKEIEALLRDVPDIDRTIVFVSTKPGAAPAYRTLAPGQRRGG